MKKAAPYLLAWLILNLVQSYFTELFHDEAHYWVFSQNLEWGFWDHPPATPFLIHLGYSLFQNELGVRLFIVLASLFTIYFLWRIVDPKDHRLFFAMTFSIFLIHIGGFMAAPDISLLLFTAAFFFFYKSYAEKDSWKTALFLGLAVAGMAYGKYHGAIILFFALLSNLKLLKRPSFYMIPLLAAVLYIPHINWQVVHDFATFRYHLIDRGEDVYHWSFIPAYIGGQLLVFGPLVAVPIFISAFRYKKTNDFEKTLKWCMVGILLFFFYRSFSERTEANWTATAMIPILYLSYHFIASRKPWRKWIYGLAIPSMFLLLVFRLFLMYDFLPNVDKGRNEFHGWDVWAHDIEEVADDAPVVFYNTYRGPAKYQFYAGKPAHSINVWSHSGNQYDLLDKKEETLQGKRVLQVTQSLKDGTPFEPGGLQKTQYKFVDDFRSFNRVKIKVKEGNQELPPDTLVTLTACMFNPTEEVVDFSEGSRNVTLEYHIYDHEEVVAHEKAVDVLPQMQLEPGSMIEFPVQLKTSSEPGSFRYRFTLHVEGLHNGRNSNFYRLELKP